MTPRDDTSYFDSIWNGDDDWVESLPDRFQGPGRDPLYSNQVFGLELVGGFRGRRGQDSLHSLVSGLASSC